MAVVVVIDDNVRVFLFLFVVDVSFDACVDFELFFKYCAVDFVKFILGQKTYLRCPRLVHPVDTRTNNLPQRYDLLSTNDNSFVFLKQLFLGCYYVIPAVNKVDIHSSKVCIFFFR